MWIISRFTFKVEKVSVEGLSSIHFVQTSSRAEVVVSLVPSGRRHLFRKSNYDDKKVLRSRSAARPGETAPLVTFSSSCGRAPLTPGWFWKWRRTFSWIKLHIQTLCWARRRPCNSPLASMASWYDCITAQTSGMPSLVCEEARITWKKGGTNIEIWADVWHQSHWTAFTLSWR